MTRRPSTPFPPRLLRTEAAAYYVGTRPLALEDGK